MAEATKREAAARICGLHSLEFSADGGLTVVARNVQVRGSLTPQVKGRTEACDPPPNTVLEEEQGEPGTTDRRRR